MIKLQIAGLLYLEQITTQTPIERIIELTGNIYKPEEVINALEEIEVEYLEKRQPDFNVLTKEDYDIE
jgi:hypothetical protein